jgi:anthranilate phosphoribosyltransferase
VAECIASVGFGFMFAPAHHAAMRHVVPVRKELGVRTIFNFLGPLTNPAGASRQLVGVSDPRYLETLAAALGRLGAERALVVSGSDGLDEVSASGPTQAVELKDGLLDAVEIAPEAVGVEPIPRGALDACDPEQSADCARAVFRGERGPERSIVVMNGGAAIYLGGAADSLAEGVRRAEEAIDSGAAAETMERFVERTKELAPS